MIIFDLDTLADDTHRRHFIDPKHNPNYKKRMWCNLDEFKNNKYIADEYIPIETTEKDVKLGDYYVFNPDYDAYKAACGGDVPIKAVLQIYNSLAKYEFFPSIEFWTSRCESTKHQTISWFVSNKIYIGNYRLKMRPVGNSEPAHALKERWLDEYMKWPELESPTSENEEKIYRRNDLPDFVFDADPDSIAMWRRRGVYCFDCRQE